MIKYITFGLLLAFLVPLRAAAEEEKKVTAPKKIFYDGRTLTCDPSWHDKETYLETNLDDDAEKEIIISFVATYTPKPEHKMEEANPNYLPQKAENETIISQNYAFYQIYDKGHDGYYHLVKTFRGMDQLGKVEILKMAKGATAFAIIDQGGEHYQDLSIYQWKEGGYRLLFNKGTSCGFAIDSQKMPLAIRIGKQCENQYTLEWEIFVWDENKNDFKQLQETIK